MVISNGVDNSSPSFPLYGKEGEEKDGEEGMLTASPGRRLSRFARLKRDTQKPLPEIRQWLLGGNILAGIM
jgi:hypothetical protein